MTEERSHFSVRERDGVQIVEFADRKILEELSITEIQEDLLRIVQATPSIRLLLSFKNVDHLSSAALGMLITLNDKVEKASGMLRLCSISPQIYEVFKITRLNKLFSIHDSTEQALKSL